MDGLRYLIVTYPGYISLPEKHSIIFQLNGINILVAVHKHLEALQIVDFNNALKKNEKNQPVLDKQIGGISEDANIAVDYQMGDAETPRSYVYDYKTTSEKSISTKFYTLLTVAYEVADPENISEDEQNFSGVILSEFIHLYKFISKDSRVRTPDDIIHDRIIEKEAIIKYTDEEKLKSLEERFLTQRNLSFGVKRFTGMQPKESVPQTEEHIIRNYKVLSLALNQGKILNEEFRLLEKAFEEVDLNRNYKYALLESFIVAESVISKSLRKIKLDKGVSKSKLEDYETEVGIGYQINVEIPVLLEHLTDNDRRILGDVDRIRKIRNKVVHEGISVSEQDALAAISSVSNLMQMLLQRSLLQPK